MAEEKNVNAEVTAEPTPEPAPATETKDWEAEYEKLKASFDKASSDVARYKKELTDRSTKEENERREREERDSEIMAELERLRTDKRVGGYSTNIMTWGMSADSAKSLASTLPDGVSDEFFAAVKAFIDTEASRIKSEALNAQPKPTAGAPVSATEAEQAMLRKYIGL